MKNNDVKKIIANTKKMAALVNHPIGFNKNNMTWQNHNKITVWNPRIKARAKMNINMNMNVNMAQTVHYHSCMTWLLILF